MADQGRFLGGAQVGEVDAVLGVALESQGGVGDDADIGAGLLRGVKHGREEQLNEEGVAKMICPKLDFVAVLGQPRWLRHDACVAKQDVKAGGLGNEVFRCGRDRGEGSKVTFDEIDFRAARDGGFDVFDHFCGGLLIAAGEIHMLRVVLGELHDGFCP